MSKLIIFIAVQICFISALATPCYGAIKQARDYNDQSKTFSKVNKEIFITPKIYNRLSMAINKYIGNNLYINDTACIGKVVKLNKFVGTLFAVSPQTAKEIGDDRYFAFGIMLHGGSCQTGVIFSHGQRVDLVATYVGGIDRFIPNRLSVYIRNYKGTKYLSILRKWATNETKAFFQKGITPSTFTTSIYNLNCTKNIHNSLVNNCIMGSRQNSAKTYVGAVGRTLAR